MQQQQEDDKEHTTVAYREDDEQYSDDETGSVMNCSHEWPTGPGPPQLTLVLASVAVTLDLTE